MPFELIDTHVHVWNFTKADYPWLRGNTSILNRSYGLEELEDDRKAVGITGGVLVQAANNFDDTDWMLEVAEKSDWVMGVVGWLPLMQPAETYRALQEKYKKQPLFKGVRHLIHDEPDAQWLLQGGVLESLQMLADSDLPYDLVGVLPQHIETALRVAEKVPSLKMVFDHLNQPPIAAKEKFGRWGELMKEAAQHPNFYAKISGMGTTANRSEWSADDIKPYLHFAFENFGAERCFCGGDWPVSLLAGSYTRAWSVYKNAIDDLLGEKEKEKVYRDNAVAFYNL